MPLFDFCCKKCAQTFELLVRGSVMLACPVCGSEDLEKQVSRPAAPGKTAALLARSRAQAAREGHFSNYAATERPRRK